MTEAKKNNSDILKLWVQAGGRCEFPGCNEYLLEDELTGINVNLADVAHIVGRKKNSRSPRGEDPLPIEDRNQVGNLMLLCSEHHNKIIDKGKLLPKFPKELLLKYKKDHEDRIKFLTGLGPNNKTVIIRLIGNIRGDSVSVSDEEIRKAVLESAGRYPNYLLKAENNIEIDLTGLPQKVDSTYWQSGKQKIDEVIGNQIFPAIDKKEIKHLSIFPLARIPFLVYLGHRLGDKVPVDLYQKHRSGDEGWVWKEESEIVEFNSSVVRTGNNNSKIALILSVSGDIKANQLPDNITDDFTIYEIRPKDVTPSRDILRSKNTLNSFRGAYQQFLRNVEKDHKQAKEIHFFPAVPVPVAIVCGRELMKDVSPSLLVYDKTKTGYNLIIKIN